MGYRRSNVSSDLLDQFVYRKRKYRHVNRNNLRSLYRSYETNGRTSAHNYSNQSLDSRRMAGVRVHHYSAVEGDRVTSRVLYGTLERSVHRERVLDFGVCGSITAADVVYMRCVRYYYLLSKNFTFAIRAGEITQRYATTKATARETKCCCC